MNMAEIPRSSDHRRSALSPYIVNAQPLRVEATTPQEAVVVLLTMIAGGKHPVQVSEFAKVPKHPGGGPATPLSWWPMGKMAIVMCPNGHSVPLVADPPGGHTIRPNGEVWPSVVCYLDGCTFHDFIQLADWEPTP